VTHACLSSMVGPFLKHSDQAALPNQLQTDAYFSDVLVFTFELCTLILASSPVGQFSVFAYLQAFVLTALRILCYLEN